MVMVVSRNGSCFNNGIEAIDTVAQVGPHNVLAAIIGQIRTSATTCSGMRTRFKQGSSFDWPTLQSHSGRSWEESIGTINLSAEEVFGQPTSIGGGSNPFHFDPYYFKYIGPIPKEDQLQMIGERLDELEVQKERWRPYIEHEQLLDPVVQRLHMEFHEALAAGGTIRPVSGGCGGGYVLEAPSGQKFMIKVVAEEIHGVLNGKGFGLPVEADVAPVREGISVYRSHQIAAFVAWLSRSLELEAITPPIAIEIVKGPFYNIFRDLSSEVLQHPEIEKLMRQYPIDGEALVYVEPFVEGACDLWDWVHAPKGVEGDQREVTQENIEQLMLLMWLIYEADGNPGNFLVRELDGQPQIIKIDNDLSMPTDNLEYRNYLNVVFTDNMENPLSEDLKARILNLGERDVEKMAEQLELEDCMQSFKERWRVLKTLVQEGQLGEITLKEADNRMQLLSYIGGELGVEAAMYPEASVSELMQVLHTYRFVGPPAMIYRLYVAGKLTEASG